MNKLTVEEGGKRLQKQLREMREELGDTQKREMEAAQRKKELVRYPCRMSYNSKTIISI